MDFRTQPEEQGPYLAPGLCPQRLVLLLFRKLASGLLAATLAGCVPPPATPQVENFAGAALLTPIAMTTLPGWASDDSSAALTAFVRGCKAIAVMPADQQLGGIGLPRQTAGQAGLWQNTCNGAQDTPPNDPAAAKAFFTTYFNAYRVAGNAHITGYFEPEYPGAKNLNRADKVPLYAKPADPGLAALSRAEIDGGALTRKTPVTAYLADPVDAYMLQIEGSGRILLNNGDTLRVGFDGQNGQPNTHIGSILVAAGDLAPNGVSFQSISNWLKSHPEQARAIMEQNQNYVFIRPLGGLADDEGAPGALGVPLTAGRTIAVDAADIPLNTPVFIATTNPKTNAPLNRLTIAQDTGGGIHGVATADLFFGAGLDAAQTAGSMQQTGTLFLLLPKPAPDS